MFATTTVWAALFLVVGQTSAKELAMRAWNKLIVPDMRGYVELVDVADTEEEKENNTIQKQ